MCDGGRLYDLSEPHDRPTTKPAGPIKIYPYVVTPSPVKGQGEDKVEPCVIKPGVGNTDPVVWCVVEFEPAAAFGDNTVAELVKLVKASIELNNKPSDVLVKIIERQQKEIDEQKEYIAANEGGPIARFLNQHPEVVQDVVKAGLEWGALLNKGLKIKIATMEAEAKEKGLLGKGVLDVTPKT